MYERPASWLAGGKARKGAIKDTFGQATEIKQAYSGKLKADNQPTEKSKDEAPKDDKDKTDGESREDENGACPEGTDLVKGITEGWTRGGDKKRITLCSIPGTKVINTSATPHWKDDRYDGTTSHGETKIVVNYKIAKDALKMARAAKKDGVTLAATISYRSLAEQCSIVIKKHSRPAA